MADQETGSRRLAEFLLERRELVLEKWVCVLKDDPQHTASKRLSPEEIRNHVGLLLEYLTGSLQNRADPEPKINTQATAAEHGRHRWAAGYRPEELILELSHLRAICIPHFFEFLERNPDIGAAGCITLSVTLHRLLDETMRSSVTEFLRAKQVATGSSGRE